MARAEGGTEAVSTLISLSEAAKILGINLRYAQELHRKGKFPVRTLKIGAYVKVRKADLDAFLEGGDEGEATPG